LRERKVRDSSYIVANNADHNFGATVNFGPSAQKRATINQINRGTIRWIKGKQYEESYIGLDTPTGTSVISVQPNSYNLAIPNLTATQRVIVSSSAPPTSSSSWGITG